MKRNRVLKKVLVLAVLLMGMMAAPARSSAERPLRTIVAQRLFQRAALRSHVGPGARIRLGRTGPLGGTRFFTTNGRVKTWGIVGPFGRVWTIGEVADGPLP